MESSVLKTDRKKLNKIQIHKIFIRKIKPGRNKW